MHRTQWAGLQRLGRLSGQGAMGRLQRGHVMVEAI
jgi:hypothetical protein